MSLYLGFGLHERIERIRRASKNLEAARTAAAEAENRLEQGNSGEVPRATPRA